MRDPHVALFEHVLVDGSLIAIVSQTNYLDLSAASTANSVNIIPMSGSFPLDPDQVPSYNEGFKTGGDLIIRSSDGIDFSVHSILLSLASSTFSDLLKMTDLTKTVNFSERAELLALVLKFIYPMASPVISSPELLNDAMRVADKYQLTSMKSRLREQLTLAESPVSAYSNPLGALCLATTHGFTAEAELAAQCARKQYEFGKSEDLMKLVDTSPTTAPLIKLIGIPLVKTRVLIEVLFHFERAPMCIYHPSSELTDALICGYCKEAYRGYVRQSPPEWQIRWAHWIFEELKDLPIAKWKGYFSHSHVSRSFHQPGLSYSVFAYKYNNSSTTCNCLYAVNGAGGKFQLWADKVYEHLKSRLVLVAQLETHTYRDSSGTGGE